MTYLKGISKSFIITKGIIELLMSFLLMYSIRFKSVSKWMVLLAFLLLVFGVQDIKFGIKGE